MVMLTIAARNYSAQALALLDSVRRFTKEVVCALCVPERTGEIPSSISLAFDYVFFVDVLAYEDLNVFMFRHDLVEGATAIKARALLHLLHRYPHEDCFIFLDPDMLVFWDLSTLFLSRKAKILLTPHLLLGEIDPQRMGIPFFRVLNGGIFNLGMIGIRRSAASIEFLQWWDSVLRHFCFAKPDRGFFVDQKWVDFALGFVDPHVIRDPGYNIAWWNARARWLELHNGVLVVSGTPVKLIHFSGITNAGGVSRNLRHVDNHHMIYELAARYNQQLLTLDYSEFIRYEWTFGAFASGEIISQISRVAFRRSIELQRRYKNPYLSSNAELLLAASQLMPEDRP